MVMLKSVKHTIHTIGDRRGGFAKTVGYETAGLVKRLGHGTTDLAKRIGPRRGLIGLAVLGGVVGGSIVLVRFLRARKLEIERRRYEAGDDLREGQAAKSSSRSAAQPSRNTYPSY